jgi:hypothetical protein
MNNYGNVEIKFKEVNHLAKRSFNSTKPDTENTIKILQNNSIKSIYNKPRAYSEDKQTLDRHDHITNDLIEKMRFGCSVMVFGEANNIDIDKICCKANRVI